jgi:FMN-dependent NADH-azoreductase
MIAQKATLIRDQETLNERLEQACTGPPPGQREGRFPMTATAPTILHIDASSRREGSLSRQLSQDVVDNLVAGTPNATIIRRDLADTTLPYVDDTWIAANFTDAQQRTAEQDEALAISNALVDELKSADTVVIGVPVYNFAIPAALKAYVDQVARARVTFKYTETGPVGLLEGKRAIVVLVSGGTTFGSDADFASGYIRHILGFIGISDVTIVDGMGVMIDADAAMARARDGIAQLSA